MENLSGTLAAIALILTAVFSYYLVYSTRKRTGAEASEKISIAYTKLLDRYDGEMEKLHAELFSEKQRRLALENELEAQIAVERKQRRSLEARFDRLEKENVIYREGSVRLYRQLEAHELKPVFVPPVLEKGTDGKSTNDSP